jgi:hypothetical protein
MSKHLGGLAFLAGIVALVCVALSLQPSATPRRAALNAPPPTPRTAQLNDELARTKIALERLRTLLPPQAMNRRPLASVFPEAADAAAPVTPPATQTSARATSGPGGAPGERRERAPRPPFGAGLAARPPLPGAASPGVAPFASPPPSFVSPPPVPAKPEPSALAAVSPPPGRLAVTYVAPEVRRAIVGARLVHVGDTLENGARVLAIADSSILLLDAEGKRVRLKIGPEKLADARPGRQP